MSEAVYVCLEEAGPMFGRLYGFGSFLASARGTTVASEFVALSLVAPGEGEKSKGSRSRVFEDSRLLLETTFCPLQAFTGCLWQLIWARERRRRIGV